MFPQAVSLKNSKIHAKWTKSHLGKTVFWKLSTGKDILQ